MTKAGAGATTDPLQRGFPPILGVAPRLLILGSMPGVASLRCGQYYGHPRNAFWPILCDLLGLPATADYARRTAALMDHGIALWDVIAACERPGSLDTAIRPATVQVNDFNALFATCPDIARIGCNGATAAREYRRRVLPGLTPAAQAIPRLQLPSTSPAHAGMDYRTKRAAWAALFEGLGASSMAT